MSVAASPDRSTKARPWATVGCCVLTLCLLFALLFPLLVQQGGSRKLRCISHIKQLGTSFLIYADSHDDRMPLVDWADGIYPYAKNWEFYTCDRIEERNMKWGYAMNFEVLGVDYGTVTKPGEEIILFETDALAKSVVANTAAVSTPRHGDKVIVCYMDTAAKARLPEDVRTK